MKKKKKKKNKLFQNTKNRNNSNSQSIGENNENELNDDEKKLVVSSLHRVLKPFLLRRIKSDVIADLPNKVRVCV